MKRGATIQLTTRLNPIWTHKAFCRRVRCSVSYRTLHRIGYIMTSRPTAKRFDISIPSFEPTPSLSPSRSQEKQSKLTNGHGHSHEFPPLQRRPCTRHEVSQKNAYSHGKKDPNSQEAIQEPKLLERRLVLVLLAAGGGCVRDLGVIFADLVLRDGRVLQA